MSSTDSYLDNSRSYDFILGFGSMPCVASHNSNRSFEVETRGESVSRGKLAIVAGADGGPRARSIGVHAVAHGG